MQYSSGKKGQENNINIFNIDQYLEKPIDETRCQYLLYGPNELRDSFILEYGFWNEDKNKSIYTKWILEHLDSKENSVIEHIFSIATRSNIRNPQLLKKAENILNQKYRYLTKLSILDYLFTNITLFPKRKIIQLVSNCYTNTRNSIIRFQSHLILFAINEEKDIESFYAKSISQMLSIQKMPTLHYRAANNIHFLSPLQKQIMKTIIFQTLEYRDFTSSVKQEIKTKFNQY